MPLPTVTELVRVRGNLDLNMLNPFTFYYNIAALCPTGKLIASSGLNKLKKTEISYGLYH